MLKTACLTSLAVLALAMPAAAADRVQAGEWETTLRIAEGAPMVSKYCISSVEAAAMNGDAATLRNYVVKSTTEKTNGRCAATKVELTGNRVSVTISCGNAEVVGTTTYFGDRYESSTSDGTTVTGKRLGACKK